MAPVNDAGDGMTGVAEGTQQRALSAMSQKLQQQQRE